MKKYILTALSVIPVILSSAEQNVIQAVRTEYGYMNAEKFLAFLENGNGGNFFDGMSVLAVLFVTFAGGIALNLTPCVLPMIPVNLAMISDSDRKNKRKGILRVSVYAAGMVVACGCAGLAAVLGGASLGGLAATWYFNLAAAIVFILLGISMFDLLILDLSKYQGKFNPPSTARLLGVFLLGGMTALLAGACVAPVVIAIMVYSAGLYASGAVWGLFLPFLLGIGMALPWPLLAAGISFLPKPGAWMNHVKHVFGFLIILIGIYYAVQAWDLYFTEHASEQNQTEDTLTAAVERSRKSGKPVLIDFYADWCKNCIVMEQTTFRNKEVKEALKKFEFVRFDATDTSSPAVQTVLNKYQIKGLPAFVILEPEK